MAERTLRRLAGRGLPWALGLADQGLWSVNTLVLTVAAARGTGPSGLGAVTVGFATALLALGLQRSFLLDPFLAAGSRLEGPEEGRGVLSLSLAAGMAAGVASAAATVPLAGPVAGGLAAFAPFLVPVLVQDGLRAVAYREDRIGAAAGARAVWVATTAILLAGGLHRSVAGMAAAWGLGAVPAALLLVRRLRCLPAPPPAAWRLWRRKLRRLGGPLSVAAVIDGASSQVETYLAAAVAGTAALGGFRAAVSAFAPLTVLRPALGQVGLPRVARAMEEDPGGAARRAAALSGVLVAACLLYAGAAAAYGRVLPLVFGAGFARYSGLLLPLTVSQLLSAAGIGIHLYLLASQRGGVMLAGTAIAVPLRAAATVVLGARFGAEGLAWAVVVATVASFAVGAVAVAADARRWSPHPASLPAPTDGPR